ncbi:phosphatidylethanolamine-binding protein 4 isoform X1 [Hyla sarda]|uniref:phosphatidylethanolamine-binding protein 4 isoform X1 n=1 Tax=Hyla sarda TaxID=327740 RepID=UPI0024C3C81E|nr:phosphatidylethanolamine-binding protein 4 isoform X1 [Hyla sarda]
MWKALLLLCHLLVVGLFSDIHASCDLQAITGDDAEICSNGFHVEYPNIGDMSCKRVTLCHNVTKDLKVAPVVTYPNAQEDKKYILMMVDPDAPSRNNPIRRYWRHWLVADIQGQDILSGEILKGKTIAEYNGPAPPANTGYHRYEFRLYVQPPDSSPALLASEEKVRANFDPDAFASRFSLGKPVAQTQFMAQNLQQKDL